MYTVELRDMETKKNQVFTKVSHAENKFISNHRIY